MLEGKSDHDQKVGSCEEDLVSIKFMGDGIYQLCGRWGQRYSYIYACYAPFHQLNKDNIMKSRGEKCLPQRQKLLIKSYHHFTKSSLTIETMTVGIS